MHAHIPTLILCLTVLAGVSILSWTMLKAWRDWIALQQMALKAGEESFSAPTPAARIELAALKERVRKLEAIASGVDLLP
jgi:hypothetical protein